MRLPMVSCFRAGGCLFVASFWLLLLFLFPTAVAADSPGDEFLTGYVVSVLERDLNWNR